MRAEIFGPEIRATHAIMENDIVRGLWYFLI